MKKIMLGTSLVLAMVIATGCGSSGDSKVDIKDISVAYKATGAYDMRDYLIPTAAQSGTYVNKTFTNEKGEKDYKDTPDSAATYTIERFEVNATTVKEFDKNNTLVTTSTITADRITQLEADDASTSVLARHVDAGDYFAKLPQVACKVEQHLASKEVTGTTYNDVLEVVCIIQNKETGMLAGKEATVNTEGSVVNYFAKDKGLLSSTINRCSTTTVGKNITKECTKETQEITIFN